MTLNQIISKILEATEAGDQEQLEVIEEQVKGLLLDDDTREVYLELIHTHKDMLEEIGELEDQLDCCYSGLNSRPVSL